MIGVATTARSLKWAVAVVLLVASGGWSQVNPFASTKLKKPRGARYGTLFLSNGKSYEGWIHLTPGRRLRFFDGKNKRAVQLPLKEIREIDVVCVNSRVEREWRFKEGGKDEKIYTGKSYARKDLTAVVTPKRGPKQKLEIALGAPIYFTPKDGKGKRQRYILQPYMRGEQGSKPDDVVHIRKIVFHPEGQKPKPPKDADAKTKGTEGAPDAAGTAPEVKKKDADEEGDPEELPTPPPSARGPRRGREAWRVGGGLTMVGTVAVESLTDLPWYIIYMVILMTTAILLLLLLVVTLTLKLNRLERKLDEISKNAGQFVRMGMTFFRDRKL